MSRDPVSRREFIQVAAASGSGLWVGGNLKSVDRWTPAPRLKPLRILILGGTGFIGPHQVRQAVERGHHVTVFNRGRRSTDRLPAGVEMLVGDRQVNDYKSLEGHRWDALIDNSAYVPRWVREASNALNGSVGHYVYTSTTGVYAFPNPNVVDEDSPLATLADPTTEKVTGETYGALKALCEAETKIFSGKVTILRPHYIVGPDDSTDRFTYYPVRIARGGEMLAPGAPSDPFQFIDVRDFAAFAIHVIERQTIGTYNVVRPPMEIGKLLDSIRKVTGSDAKFTWVDTSFLKERKVALPMWDPPVGAGVGEMNTTPKRAVAAGLRHTRLETTVKDTLAWWQSLPEDRRAKPRAFLPAERETELLAEWHARAKSQ
jgi:2'-hydroxyisoflavone reductase